MGLRRFMANQLRKPSGWFGSLVISRGMNQGNRRITERALELLEIRPGDQVLRIGKIACRRTLVRPATTFPTSADKIQYVNSRAFAPSKQHH